jgi:hypothetical protein
VYDKQFVPPRKIMSRAGMTVIIYDHEYDSVAAELECSPEVVRQLRYERIPKNAHQTSIMAEKFGVDLDNLTRFIDERKQRWMLMDGLAE